MANYNLTSQTISSSFQQLVQYDRDTGSLYDGTGSLITDLDITASVATSASHALNADIAISASHAEKADTITGYVWAATDGEQNSQLTTDGAGNLSFKFPVKTVINIKNLDTVAITRGTPVYISGVQGNGLYQVKRADASNSAKMPAIGLVRDASLAVNGEGFAVMVGNLRQYDTTGKGWSVGQGIYVAAGGGLTGTRPIGSNLIQKVANVGSIANNGDLIVVGAGRTNDVPNLSTGYAWVGNGNQVATAVSTASWDEKTDITSLNSFTSSYYVDSASFDSRIDGIVASGSGADWLTNLTNIPAGLVSGSSQINYADISNIPSGILSGSDQLTGSFAVLNGGNTFTGNQVVSSGNIELSGTGQTITNNNGAIVASTIEGQAEMASPLLLVDSIEVNTGTNIAVKSIVSASADITGSRISSTGIAITATNNDVYPLEASNPNGSSFNLFSKNDEDVSGVFLQVAGFAEFGAGTTLSTNSPSQDPLIVDDGAAERLQILSQNGASAAGYNINLNGTTRVGGQLKPQDNIDMSGVSGKVINNPNGTVEANEVSANGMLTDSLEGFTGGTTPIQVNSRIKFNSNISSDVVDITIASSTASVDFADVQVQTLTLPASGDTHIVGTNVGDGQVLNLLIKTTGTGTVSFSGDFLQPSGSSYSATSTAGGRDILTFATYDNSTTGEIYLVNVVNLV